MNNFGIHNLSAYTTPEIIENVSGEFVEYGDDNQYFQFLIDRYAGSTTNNAILTGITRNIFGKGLNATDSSTNVEQYAQMLDILQPRCLKKFIGDRMILGMGALQITKKAGKVIKISHFPMETLRAEKADEKGNIKAYYYHPNWAEYKMSDNPQRINAFGFGKKSGNEIYVLKPYSTGCYYYSPVDYSGALPYALLEEEISNYLINDTLNGFSGTKVINFNNGEPDVEKQREIVSQTLNKLTGTLGQKVLVSFNNSKEQGVEIQDLSLNNAPEHYQYLADECFRKLIIGHRITSPMLLGVRDGNSGFGSNADEIKNATLLFDNYVIKGYQEEILECLEEILVINGISLDLYFETLSPIEFTDVEKIEDVGGDEEVEKETGIEQDGDDVEEEKLSLYNKLVNYFKKEQ